MASMWKSSTLTSGYSLATSRHTSRNRPVVIFRTLALCTMVTRLSRRIASSNADLAIRSVAGG